MSKKRKVYSASFKAKVALEAIKGQKTLQELSAEFGVSPQFIQQQKAKLKESLVSVFEDKRCRSQKEHEIGTSDLLEEIGRLKMQLDWLKKKSNELVPGICKDSID